MVNAAKSRYFKLDLGEGHVFRKIGGDGGLTEYSEDHDFIVLGAGERAGVLVTPTGEPGGEGLVRSLLHDRGYGSIFGRDFESLFTIRFADEPPYDPGPLPRTSREMEAYDLEGATGIDLELTLQKDPYDQTFAYGINHVPFWRAKPILAGLGETQVCNVTNSTAWSHPLHLHGFFFLVLDEAGEPVRPLEWKDTVDIPHERTVRLTVRFDERPGTWIFHCHILDHADGGLLSAVHLGLPPEEFRNLASTSIGASKREHGSLATPRLLGVSAPRSMTSRRGTPLRCVLRRRLPAQPNGFRTERSGRITNEFIFSSLQTFPAAVCSFMHNLRLD